jgi:hypothetical protein
VVEAVAAVEVAPVVAAVEVVPVVAAEVVVAGRSGSSLHCSG